MALPSPALKKPPTILSPEEGRELFDYMSRRIAGLSGDEFLARYDAGDISPDDETHEGRELMYLIMLIPFARQDS
ncbi:MAG: hypothetical protein QM692_24210 [Thermomicrobiales bacterium]